MCIKIWENSLFFIRGWSVVERLETFLNISKNFVCDVSMKMKDNLVVIEFRSKVVII